ncbi:MAG: hypothetical protein ACTSUO_02350 [Candidatus Thorarchaeota archaeon]
MASKRHDFIVSAVVRKMRLDGFDIVYLDGRHHDISTTKPEIPPTIIHHKPDVIGEKKDGIFCIGEAKTESDISSERTRNQVSDFMAVVLMNEENRLILGVPLNSTGDLEALLRKLGCWHHKQIDIIHIPEELLPYEKEI